MRSGWLENQRLKPIVTDQTSQNQTLKEIANGKLLRPSS